MHSKEKTHKASREAEESLVFQTNYLFKHVFSITKVEQDSVLVNFDDELQFIEEWLEKPMSGKKKQMFEEPHIVVEHNINQ